LPDLQSLSHETATRQSFADAPRGWQSLKKHFKRELDLPRGQCASDGAELGGAISTGRREVGLIQSVENLTAKLQILSFAPERELLVNAKIQILIGIAASSIASRSCRKVELHPWEPMTVFGLKYWVTVRCPFGIIGSPLTLGL
jgi:hypothetical protein